METERTFVMVKPDGVQRGLVGECISRFERVGLKLVAMKMVKPSADFVEKHYPSSEEWLRSVGDKTLNFYKEHGLDAKQLGAKDNLGIGKLVKKWLCDFISSGPVVAMVWEGPFAIEQVRKITGNTLPALAAPGTIRGDFSVDSSFTANAAQRCIHNIIHASANREEAENEVKLWFQEREIISWKRADEKALFG
ncbi:MAG: nucleoside-diphosphate kinase [Candidatus Norongarragalinales archaeon]